MGLVTNAAANAAGAEVIYDAIGGGGDTVSVFDATLAGSEVADELARTPEALGISGDLFARTVPALARFAPVFAGGRGSQQVEARQLIGVDGGGVGSGHRISSPRFFRADGTHPGAGTAPPAAATPSATATSPTAVTPPATVSPSAAERPSPTTEPHAPAAPVDLGARVLLGLEGRISFWDALALRFEADPVGMVMGPVGVLSGLSLVLGNMFKASGGEGFIGLFSIGIGLYLFFSEEISSKRRKSVEMIDDAVEAASQCSLKGAARWSKIVKCAAERVCEEPLIFTPEWFRNVLRTGASHHPDVSGGSFAEMLANSDKAIKPFLEMAASSPHGALVLREIASYMKPDSLERVFGKLKINWPAHCAYFGEAMASAFAWLTVQGSVEVVMGRLAKLGECSDLLMQFSQQLVENDAGSPTAKTFERFKAVVAKAAELVSEDPDTYTVEWFRSILQAGARAHLGAERDNFVQGLFGDVAALKPILDLAAGSPTGVLVLREVAGFIEQGVLATCLEALNIKWDADLLGEEATYNAALWLAQNGGHQNVRNWLWCLEKRGCAEASQMVRNFWSDSV